MKRSTESLAIRPAVAADAEAMGVLLNEIIRIGVLNGLAELGDAKGVAVAQALAAPGQPFAARPAALSCLGQLAKQSSKAREALHGHKGSK